MIIEIRVKTKSPLVIASSSSLGLSKEHVEIGGKPIIPGSAIKGALREHSNMLVHKYEAELNSLFGTAQNIGKLYFTKLKTSDERVYIEKHHNSIDKKTRIAIDKKLFNVRAIKPGVEFTGKIYSKKDLTNREMEALKLLAKLTVKLGAMKSRGYGFVDIEVKEKPKSEESIDLENLSNVMLISVEPIEPLMITSTKVKSYLYNSFNYIPGNVLRGAYASLLNPNKQEFKEIFLKEMVKFPNLYPSTKTSYYTLPATDFLLTEKYSADFTIYNALAEMVAVSLLNHKGYRLSIRAKSPEGKRLDRVSGWIKSDSFEIDQSKIKKHFSAQVALDNKLRSAKYGALRTYNASNPSQLSGVIRTEDINHLELLKQKWLTLGGSKTRGYGLVEIKSFTPMNFEVKKRIAEFNKKLKSLLAPEEFNSTFVPIIMRSDLIIGNAFCIESLLGKTYKLEYMQLRSAQTSGWNTASNSPKCFQNVIGAGSVLVYSTDKTPDDIEKDLKELYIKGLGRFTGSGFGEFIVGK